ncbi:hypothetical protein QD712_25495 [Streptomyces acidiscabies]|uniref:hypothetical protein n=1 Tax=Streptomyces acidiscabies TaxID=42234 RepID=UPI0030CEB479
MTVKATRMRRAPAKAPNMPNSLSLSASSVEAEFRRWTPEEVVEMRLLPYRSVRVLRDKCHRRELFCHRDGGRVTFTAEDLRRNNEIGAQTPFTPPAA